MRKANEWASTAIMCGFLAAVMLIAGLGAAARHDSSCGLPFSLCAVFVILTAFCKVMEAGAKLASFINEAKERRTTANS